ncbi:MAG: SdrD B-like domain-containing protein [Tepidisphaeraceae bacterium]
MLRSTRIRRSSRSHRDLMTTLESRQLMAVTLGVNAVVNPSGDATAGATSASGIVVPTGWTANGNATIVKYGTAGGFPTTSSPGPIVRGQNFFAGGPNNTASDFFQTLDISNVSAVTDANHLQYQLRAYLGGFGSQTDNAWVFMNFQNGSGGFISQVNVGPVSPADRGNVTGLLQRSKLGNVPAGTRKIQFQIHFENPSGGYNDGYADDLQAIFTEYKPATTGSIAGTVYNDADGNGSRNAGTEPGLANVKVYIDKNNNNTPDAGDIISTTNSSGAYSLPNLPAGTYTVKQVLPAQFRATTPSPQTIVVGAGQNLTGKDFGDSQTIRITGQVWGDTDGSKTINGTEKGLANVVVYLDFNNNGELDSFELKTTSDANGNYAFNLPYGTYVLRVVLPAGKTLTTPTPSYTVTAPKATVVTGKNFGIK